MRRRAITLFPFFLILFASVACTTGTDTLTPQEAILEMEQHPFSGPVLEQSAQSLKQALQKTPDDTWANIGAAELYLRIGYKVGSRYKQDNYVPEALDNAYTLAQRAIELAPDNSRAYALLAKLQIIRGEYKTAWETLNQAHKLDPDSFYPWYYLTVLNRYYKLYDKAKYYADRAESLAQYTHQRRWVIGERKNIADATGDLKAEEQAHLALIALEPDRPHPYGNYATFLYYQKRYTEAVTYFEKAIAISPYPKAVELLEKSRQRLTEATKE